MTNARSLGAVYIYTHTELTNEKTNAYTLVEISYLNLIS